MAPYEPTLASCEAQQASCEAKVLCGPIIVSSNETNLALPELATVPVGANLASRQVRDGSFHLASDEATPAYSGRKAKMYGIALNRAMPQAHSFSESKAKAPCSASTTQACLSSEAKAKAPCGTNPAQLRSEVNIVLLKAPARLYTASFPSSSETIAPCANSASPCEA